MTKTITTLILTGTLTLAAFLLAPASLTTLAPSTPALAARGDDHDSFWAQPYGNTATPIAVDDGR